MGVVDLRKAPLMDDDTPKDDKAKADKAARRLNTKAARQARDKLLWDLTWLHRDNLVMTGIREDIPNEWHTLEVDIAVEEAKDKVTLYLDRSVARTFKAMGKGYQSRINRLLRTWLQMKIADELRIDEMLRVQMAEEREKEAE